MEPRRSWRGGRFEAMGVDFAHAELLDFEEAAVGAEVLAVEAGFVAIDEVEGARGGGEGAEGHGGQETGMKHGGAIFIVFGDELGIHGVALDVPDALLAPAGYSHGVDERFFEGGGGLEFAVESGDEVEEGLGFLAAEEDVGGENAVFEGGARRGEFTDLTTSAALCFCVAGIRPDRFTAVRARSLDLMV